MNGAQRLADEELWQGPLAAAPRLLDELHDGARRGLHLWAPGLVPLDTRRSLPAYVGMLGEKVELDRLAFAERVIVVAVDTDTGHTQALPLARNGGREAPARMAPPPGFEGGIGPGSSALAAEVVRFALWGAPPGASPWPPGRYSLTAIAADRVSNDALVEIVRSPTTVDPSVREARAAERPLEVWPPPDPAGGLPRYAAAQGSLSPPPGLGVVLAAERVVTVREGAMCPLRGVVVARARDAHRARHGAVVPVTLVITGSETPTPVVVSMCIPSFDREVRSSDAQVTAHFAVDLFRLAPLAATPQTYFIHAFTADGHAGPQPIAVVA